MPAQDSDSNHAAARGLRRCSADSADERFAGIGSRTYDLTFSEEKPLGTSPYAWRYTGVKGAGWGFFFANRESRASANYHTSVKQGTATLNGLKTYGETLTETNDYPIGSPSLPQNPIFADWAH